MERTVKVKEEAEQVIMVGVSVEDGDDAMDSLDELEELLRTAGAEVAGTVLQNREMIHPGTYVGKARWRRSAACSRLPAQTGLSVTMS